MGKKIDKIIDTVAFLREKENKMNELVLDLKTKAMLDRARRSSKFLSIYEMRWDLAEAAGWTRYRTTSESG